MTKTRQEPIDPTTNPWPYWMLRYIGANSSEAFEELVWSVGGSPPYGGVSYEEAAAVYDLLEDYSGPGQASDKAYQRVEGFIKRKPERMEALELFRVHDRIASDPDNVQERDVDMGLHAGQKSGHAGVLAYFLALKAELHYDVGEIEEAKVLILEALTLISSAAVDDYVYEQRVVDLGQNAIVFSVLDGDFQVARTVASALRQVVVARAREGDSVMAAVAETPRFPKHLDAILDRASDLLEAGDTVRALEWYLEAERVARQNKNHAALRGLLGDKAVAFRRLGNIPRALETYYEVIDRSRQAGDALNLARWSGNLGQLLLMQDDAQAAEPYLKEAMAAALQTGLPDQISLASSNYAMLLQQQGRFQEAIELMDIAQRGGGGKR